MLLAYINTPIPEPYRPHPANPPLNPTRPSPTD